MTVEWTVLITIGTALLTAVLSYAAYRRNFHKDAAEKGRSDGVLLTELGYVKAGIDTINRKMEKQDQHHVEVIARLSAVEQSAKQAHKRIDDMGGKRSNI